MRKVTASELNVISEAIKPRVQVLENLDEFPYVGRLSHFDGERFYICTGIFLPPNHVLTANHCKDGFRKDPIFFLAFPKDAEENFRSAKLVESPKVASMWRNDWAIYELEKPLDYKGPAPKFANLDSKKMVGVEVTSIGYGLDAEREYDSQKPLQAMNCKMTAPSYQKNVAVTDCYSAPGMSGGPILAKINGEWTIIGVNSGTQTGPYFDWFGRGGNRIMMEGSFHNAVQKYSK